MIEELLPWTNNFIGGTLKVVPVLPGREIVVAYLNEAGFSMFEPHDKGVVAHGDVEEVDVALAQGCLEEVRAFARQVQT